MTLRTIAKALGASALALGLVCTAAQARQTSNPRNDVDSQQLRGILDQNGDVTNVRSFGHDGWFDRVAVSGVIRIMGTISNRTISNVEQGDPAQRPVSAFYHKHTSDIAVENAEVNFDAQVNCWTRAHLVINGDDPLRLSLDSNDQDHSRFVSKHDGRRFDVDEAYVTFANFAQSPFYGTIGRQYVPFGNYERHRVIPLFTTVLSETQATAAKIGFIMNNGLQASAYAFSESAPSDNVRRNRVENWGVDLGFTGGDTTFAYNLGIGYLRNMADVDAISNAINPASTLFLPAGWEHRVHAWSGYVHLTGGPWLFNVDYTGAGRNFDATDLPFKDGGAGAGTGEARPRAWSIEGGYNFSSWGHDSTVAIGYERTREALALLLPRSEYHVSYTVDLLKNTSLQLEVARHNNYSDNDYTQTYANNFGIDDVKQHKWIGAALLQVDFA